MEIADHVTQRSHTIAAQIVYFRQMRGMSQEALARACGMKQSAIARLERTEDCKWTTTTLLRLAAALDMKVDVRIEAER